LAIKHNGNYLSIEMYNTDIAGLESSQFKYSNFIILMMKSEKDAEA